MLIFAKAYMTATSAIIILFSAIAMIVKRNELSTAPILYFVHVIALSILVIAAAWTI